MTGDLVLASASPQRRAILEQIGVSFEIRPADVKEETHGDPVAVAEENARRKALAVPSTLTLGADTLVAVDGDILGKPADASLVMQLGAEGVFVGSGIFKSEDPATRAAAIVEATTHFKDPERVARASEGLGMAMQSLETRKLEEGQLLANRGW